jgi:hypothetical protein
VRSPCMEKQAAMLRRRRLLRDLPLLPLATSVVDRQLRPTFLSGLTTSKRKSAYPSAVECGVAIRDQNSRSLQIRTCSLASDWDSWMLGELLRVEDGEMSGLHTPHTKMYLNQ